MSAHRSSSEPNSTRLGANHAFKVLRALVTVTTLATAVSLNACTKPAQTQLKQTMTAGHQDAVVDDYTCAMHRQVHSDHGGPCPICGMTMVKRSTLAPAAGHAGAGSAQAANMPAGLKEIALSPEQQVMANVATEPVAARTLVQSLTAPGRVTFDETRLAQVTARFGGRIEQLYANSTGASVRKGRSMGTIYSPEAVSAMQDFLTALKTYEDVKDSPYPDISDSARDVMKASRDRLHLWGMTERQLGELERTKTPNLSLDLVAPRSGVITKKNVEPGQYVKEGDVLYEVADLSQVWAEADVFEADMRNVHVGQTALITTPSYPGKTFRGQVAFIDPFLSAESRTVKVRVALSNPRGDLKPDMYVTAALETGGSGSQLAVPASAVIDTGKRKIVYVEETPGTYRPREVTLGAKADRYYPVIAGLSAGDKVAVSGGFLLDATSQIQSGGMQDMPGMDHSTPTTKPADKPSSDGMENMPGMSH